MRCYWCDEEIERWYIRYKGHVFCMNNDSHCVKNFWYEHSEDEYNVDYYPPRETEFEAAAMRREISNDISRY